MSLLEYLMFKYSKTIPQVLNAPQGNKEEIEKAQKEFAIVQAALDDVQRQLDQQKQAKEEVHKRLHEQKKKVTEQNQKLEEQKQRLQEQKLAEEEVRKSEREQTAAVEELRGQENAFQTMMKDLAFKSEKGETIVARSKAAQELAQLKQENPLPLRKAKITQEAALRKVEKQRKEAENATAKCLSIADELAKVKRELDIGAQQLEVAKNEVEEATRRVEEAVRDTEVRMAEAEAYLEEVKKHGGNPDGAIWWIERELKEAKKYLPQRKQ